MQKRHRARRPVDLGVFREVRIRYRFEARWPALLRFFNRIERHPRFMTIQAFQIVPRDWGYMHVLVWVATYRYGPL